MAILSKTVLLKKNKNKKVDGKTNYTNHCAMTADKANA